MILKLKREIAQLKEELAMATGEQRTDALSEEDLQRLYSVNRSFPHTNSFKTYLPHLWVMMPSQSVLYFCNEQNEKWSKSLWFINIFRCKEEVQRYLEDTDPDCIINIGADMRKIQECFRLFKVSIEINRFIGNISGTLKCQWMHSKLPKVSVSVEISARNVGVHFDVAKFLGVEALPAM